jgi:ribosome-associated protein
MGRKKTVLIEDESLVSAIIEAIREKKGKNIVKLDLRELKNTICDYFIICEGDSTTQVNALADNVEKQTYIQLSNSPHHIEGRENAQWILLDYFSVIVHVFQKDNRDFYKLEDLWSDGKIEIFEE